MAYPGDLHHAGVLHLRHHALGYLRGQQVAVAAPHQRHRAGNPPRQVPRYLWVGTPWVGADRRVHPPGVTTLGKGLDRMTGSGLPLRFGQGAEPDPLLPVPGHHLIHGLKGGDRIMDAGGDATAAPGVNLKADVVQDGALHTVWVGAGVGERNAAPFDVPTSEKRSKPGACRSPSRSPT